MSSSSSHALENGGMTSKRARTTSASVPSESRLLELSVPLSTRTSAESEEDKNNRAIRLADAVKELLVCLGEDPSREGLLDTPKRTAEAFLFWTKGYDENLVRFSGAVADVKTNTNYSVSIPFVNNY